MTSVTSIIWDIGVDEVGRGCLAGPVYAAAVMFNPENPRPYVRDSKKLSAARREEIAEVILRHHFVGIAFATVEEIEELNILHASLLAMKRAVDILGRPGRVLVDGNQKVPGIENQVTVISGDSLVPEISAASIVAKVTRDRWMMEQEFIFPNYGFSRHKGYGTAEHQEALKKFGPCALHREGFAGLSKGLEGTPS